MEKLIEKLNKYYKLRDEILEAFGVDSWESIENHLACRWYSYDESNEISWLDESGTEYGFDYASQVGDEVDGCRLFYVQDNGEKFYALFSSSLRYEDYDDFEAQMGVEI